MQYILIIELVIELIAKCLENRDRDRIISGMENPRFLEAITMRRVLRKYGFKGKELKDQSRECMNYLSSMNRGEIIEIVSEAEAFNDKG